MATHSSILAWNIPWTEEPDKLTVHGVAKSQSNQPILKEINPEYSLEGLVLKLKL